MVMNEHQQKIVNALEAHNIDGAYDFLKNNWEKFEKVEYKDVILLGAKISGLKKRIDKGTIKTDAITKTQNTTAYRLLSMIGLGKYVLKNKFKVKSNGVFVDIVSVIRVLRGLKNEEGYIFYYEALDKITDLVEK